MAMIPRQWLVASALVGLVQSFHNHVGGAWVRSRDRSSFCRLQRAANLALAAADTEVPQSSQQPAIFSQPPEEIFATLCKMSGGATDGFLRIQDLTAWGELQDLINDQDLLPQELEEIFAERVETGSPNDNDTLDQSGFVSLYNEIEGLFEGEDFQEEDVDSPASISPETTASVPEEPTSTPATVSKKEDLVELLSTMNRIPDRLPCGLDCTEKERQAVASLVSELEQEEHSNLVLKNNGKVDAQSLIGEWELLYTSSRTMTINKSLSGLGRSASSKANFASLTQRLTGSNSHLLHVPDKFRFLGAVEYLERFGTGPESFTVTVTGEWLLEDFRNQFTGAPVTAVRVDPEKVAYGPMTNPGDSWASLGPIKLLDVLYLTDDLKIYRGNVNTESIFVFRRNE